MHKEQRLNHNFCSLRCILDSFLGLEGEAFIFFIYTLQHNEILFPTFPSLEIKGRSTGMIWHASAKRQWP